VNARRASLLLASSLLLALGCGSTASSKTDAASDGPRQPPRDAGRDHQGTRDAARDHASVVDARNDRTGDARVGADAGVRTLTTRALLPTPVNSLLIDPFVTYDESWGHFRAVVPAVEAAETGGDCPSLTREFVSASAAGIAAPAVLVNPTVLPVSTGCTAIIAPFVGSSEPVTAQIWVSLSDAAGAPVAFPSVTDAGMATIDGFVTVAILPNTVPSSLPPASYPFEVLPPAPVTAGGRQWGLLGLRTAVAIPDGGWFAITFKSQSGGLYLAAPAVVPTGASQIVQRAAPRRPMTEIERGAMLQYGRLLQTRRPPRRHTRQRP
jgi:hypothetical protein